jgi:tetratricopeptide (TPR) repeat protein
LPVKTTSAWTRYLARRFEESIAVAEAALEMDPTFAPLYNVLAWSCSAAGRHERAVEAARGGVALSGRGNMWLITLGFACAAAGRRDDAEQVLSELDDAARQRYVSRFGTGAIRAWLGDFDGPLSGEFAHRADRLASALTVSISKGLLWQQNSFSPRTRDRKEASARVAATRIRHEELRRLT